MKINKNLIPFAREEFLVFCSLIFTNKGLEFRLESYTIKIYHMLMKVLQGEVSRLIINMPPRHGKTEFVIILFTAWLYGKYPKSDFLHASYTKELACKNSQKIRDIINSDIYKVIFPNVKLKVDSKAKHNWGIENGGTFYAAGTTGSLTGFGAGIRGSKEFSGAILIDDPHKVSEIYSEKARINVIDWYTETIQSRLNTSETPIIIIMQRLHLEDLTGYILNKDKYKDWIHLKIPLIDEKNNILDKTIISRKEVERLKIENVSFFNAQYLQDPIQKGGNLFKEIYWKFWKKENILHEDEKLPTYFQRVIITADTAQKTGEHNDYSVFQCWGLSIDDKMYLLDQFRKKVEAPELRTSFVSFYNKMCSQYTVHSAHIEDHASGIGLIQELRNTYGITTNPIKRLKDKYARAYDIVHYIERGDIYIPNEDIELKTNFIKELNEFNSYGKYKHDDQVDCFVDAVDILKRNNRKVETLYDRGIIT